MPDCAQETIQDNSIVCTNFRVQGPNSISQHHRNDLLIQVLCLVCASLSPPPALALIISPHRHPFLDIRSRFIRYNNKSSFLAHPGTHNSSKITSLQPDLSNECSCACQCERSSNVIVSETSKVFPQSPTTVLVESSVHYITHRQACKSLTAWRETQVTQKYQTEPAFAQTFMQNT